MFICKHFPSVTLPSFFFIYLSLPLLLYLYLSICLSIYLSVYRWIYLCVYLPAYLSVFLPVYVFTYALFLLRLISFSLSLYTHTHTHTQVRVCIHTCLFISHVLFLLAYLSIYLSISAPVASSHIVYPFLYTSVTDLCILYLIQRTDALMTPFASTCPRLLPS